MEFIILTAILAYSVIFMIFHIRKTFKEGEKCSSCPSRKGGCASRKHI